MDAQCWARQLGRLTRECGSCAGRIPNCSHPIGFGRGLKLRCVLNTEFDRASLRHTIYSTQYTTYKILQTHLHITKRYPCTRIPNGLPMGLTRSQPSHQVWRSEDLVPARWPVQPPVPCTRPSTAPGEMQEIAPHSGGNGGKRNSTRASTLGG